MALLKTNTGIGITNPSEALHVAGNGLFDGTVSAISFTGNLSGTATSAINLVGGEKGSVPYQSAVNSTSFLSPGTEGQVLVTGGIGQNPYWAPVSSASGSFGGITIKDDGIVVGSASSISSLNFVGANISATASGIAATITIADNLVGTSLSISGVSTFTNGPVLIGSGTSTGTISQRLQVTGGAYVSGNLGIGTTNPTSKLHVVGDGRYTGVVTATTFVGALAGTATSATQLVNARTISLTGDVVGSVSFDGSTNVSIASTIQPNSVELGTDTFGDYVESISGTFNQITVTSGTGEGSTPTLSIPNQFTAPQDVTVTRDLQVNRNLNVDGNITIGGTSATLFTTELKVADPDIVLGFRTDANNNDISTDNTANHGGIAIASTEGSPLVQLYNVSIGENNPATYKKIMWFKSGSFVGLNTDAWLFNYAIGIGSTQFPSGTRLAAGSVQFTENDLAVVRNINSSGIITAASFSGNTSSSNYATASGVSTSVIGGIGSITQLQVTGVSTFTNGPVFVGIATSTGTASQPLQVTGGAYVSGNVGVGTTNPTSTLQVQGTVSVSSTTTSAEFIGGGSDLRNLSGTHLVSYASHSETSNSSLSIAGISTYNQVGILTGSLAVNSSDNFGYSVATSADGKTIIVGAWQDEVGATTNTGVVYVYDRIGNSFNQVGILTGFYAVDINDNFGFSVETSADGKTIIVGAWQDEVGATTNTGVVYVYDRIGNSFNQVGILTGSYAVDASDNFGWSVATSADGKTIIVGAFQDEIGANTSSGVVYVFDRIENSFNQVGILTGSYAVDASDNFGRSIATSADGKTIIVGAYRDEVGATTSTGVVYVFDRIENSFNQVGILTGSLAVNSSDNFGYSVATSADGKTIIVGAFQDEVGATTNTGVVYVFDRIGNSFNQVGILTGSYAVDSTDYFGWTVATSADGKTIIVGANQDEVDATTSTGVVYVFKREGNSFNQVGILTGFYAVDTNDFFGSSVATSADGKTIIVGAYNDEISATAGTGIVYVFDEIRDTYVYSGPTGNIGIGTTNPTSKLHVVGNVLVSGIITATTFVGNLTGTATSAGIATYADTAGIATYATNAGIATYATNAGIATYATNAGIATYATNAGIATYATASGVSTSVIGGIGSITQLQVTGVSTFTNGPILVGTATSTGTTSQRLQVTGGAYVSGNVGVGTTNPTSTLQVQGSTRLMGELYDGNNVAGTSGQILQTTGSGIQWINPNTTNVGSANSIAITADSTNASRYLTFVSATSGNNIVYVDSDLLYNPFTNVLGINTISFTGTSSQNLQVTGGAYVSGNLGIGITNPTTKLQVNGTIGFSDTNIKIGDSLTGSNITSGINNIFIGNSAGAATSNTSNNTFLGRYSGLSNIANGNNFFGFNAGRYNTTGYDNNFFGFNAGRNNTTGFRNIFLGSCAGFGNSTAGQNIFIGFRSGCSNTGNYNNFFGGYTGQCNTGNNNTFIGHNSGRNNTSGNSNNFIGVNAGYANTTGFNNNFFGRNSGCSNTTGGGNNFFGVNAGGSNTSGSNNNFIGHYAGVANTTGSANNFFGQSAGRLNTTGLHNNFFGSYAGRENITGKYNNFFGNGAGRFNISGISNNFLGYAAGSANTTGSYNNFFGQSAGISNTSGSNNNFIGAYAGRFNTTGCNNNFIGRIAGFCNTTGKYNNFFGLCAGYGNTTGSGNNFLGFRSGCNNTGSCNNFFGEYTGLCNTGNGNNFIGPSAGRNNTSGNHNNFFGTQVGTSNTIGSSNNFFGYFAGRSNTTGSDNNFFGNAAGLCNTSGNDNNFFGTNSGCCNTTGFRNNFIGRGAGRFNTSGSDNNFLGYYSGYSNTTGNGNNFFGTRAGSCNTTGCLNNFFGLSAGCCNTTGRYNNFFGAYSGSLNTTGGCNNFIGRNAGYGNTTGSHNNFLGFRSGCNNTGSSNNFFGEYTGLCNTGGGNNFIGPSAGRNNTSGGGNNFLGPSAGFANTTGSNNNFFGNNAGGSNTTGTDNNFLGDRSGRCNTTGFANNFFGNYSGRRNTSGSYNNFFGFRSGWNSTTGGCNNFFGRQVGSSNINGAYNNFFGAESGQSNTSGCYNIFIGKNAGFTNTSGSFNTFVGSFSGISATASRKVILGSGDAFNLFDAPKTNVSTQFAVGNNISGTTNYWIVGDENYNIGIGTTNPTEKLQVQGNISINGNTSYGSIVTTTATTSQVGIHSSLSTSTYRSVEYTIQASQGTNYHATKILAIHNGSIAYNSEYGTIYNNASVGAFDVDISGGNIRLLVTPASASTTNYTINFIAIKI